MHIEEMKRRKAELGYTNERIAQLSGVPLSTVQKIFAGVTRQPRYDTLLALEEVLSPVHQGEDALRTEGFGEAGSAAGRVRETEFHYSTDHSGKSAAGKKQGEYTLEDYYALTGERRAELIDGVIYFLSSPSVLHQILVLELGTVLKEYIRKKGGDCVVGLAPLDVHLCENDEKNILEPDISVICDREKIIPKRIEGAPDLVIEILSQSTRKRDMGVKYLKYLEAGVREYWIVDPDSRRVVVYLMETEALPQIYTFDEQIPVGIFGEDCFIDFAEICEENRFFFELKG